MSSVVHSFNNNIKAHAESIKELKEGQIQFDKNATDLAHSVTQHTAKANIRDEGFNARIEGLEKQQDGLVQAVSKNTAQGDENQKEIAEMRTSITGQNASISSYVDELSLKIDNSHYKLANSSEKLEKRLSKLEKMYGKLADVTRGKTNQEMAKEKESVRNSTEEAKPDDAESHLESPDVIMRSVENENEQITSPEGNEDPAAFQKEWSELEKATTPSPLPTGQSTLGVGRKRKMQHEADEDPSPSASSPTSKRRPSHDEGMTLGGGSGGVVASNDTKDATSGTGKEQERSAGEDKHILMLFGALYAFGLLTLYTCGLSVLFRYAGQR